MSDQPELLRSSWTCEIDAGELADVVEVHLEFWERKSKTTTVTNDTVAIENKKNWKRWLDFLESIEPTEMLPLTIDDFAFFYDEFLDRKGQLS